MLDEPKILADFEISRWMGVGYPLDGAIFTRQNDSSTYRGKIGHFTSCFKKLFPCLSRRTCWTKKNDRSDYVLARTVEIAYLFIQFIVITYDFWTAKYNYIHICYT